MTGSSVAQKSIPKKNGAAKLQDHDDVQSTLEQLQSELVIQRAMVENSPTNIILADQDLVITYVNPASQKTLKLIENHLPVRAAEVLGQSVDIFHKDPSVQRRILSDPRNLPHRAIIPIGPEKAELLVSAVYDNNGRYLGPMITWELVTEKLKNQSDAAEKTAIVENAPINIMLASRDGKIIYLNPASVRTLKTIEHALPIRVDQIVGSSYDVFHKNPEHQRRLLADPRNLPYSAEIQLGEETLLLNASAIYDGEGNYAGPMVAWDKITDRKVAELREKENRERELRAEEELRRNVDALLVCVEAAAEGDLTKNVEVNSQDAVGELAAGLKKMIVDLR
jgi:methyl-accepting chemotaxis protein